MDSKIPEISKGEILSGIKEQIAAFDNKASILIAVLGIVFAFSFGVIELFITDSFGWWIYLFYSLYLLSLAISIVLSLSVIIPRERKKSITPYSKSCTYYGDLKEITENEFIESLTKETHFEQIQTTSKIAWRKHKFIRASIFSLIAVGAFLFALIISILAS